jgi:hypothetical protein
MWVAQPGCVSWPVWPCRPELKHSVTACRLLSHKEWSRRDMIGRTALADDPAGSVLLLSHRRNA